MRVLVTGASRGIGRAVCARLARDGAQVAACASAHRDELDTLVAEIRSAGGVAVPLPGDLRDGATPARLVREAAAALGGLDAVVGNAGISSPGPLATLDVADWDRVFAVNLRAQFLLTQAAHPWLQRSRGSLVTIASMSGVQPYAGIGAYSATKAALIMLTRQLAQEWAADGIGEAGPDIAGTVAFLLGPDAAYMTRHNLLVDGGLLDSVQTHLAGRPRTGS